MPLTGLAVHLTVARTELSVSVLVPFSSISDALANAGGCDVETGH
jgi:hypothetical protein